MTIARLSKIAETMRQMVGTETKLECEVLCTAREGIFKDNSLQLDKKQERAKYEAEVE
jgi:hypothetical protein